MRDVLSVCLTASLAAIAPAPAAGQAATPQFQIDITVTPERAPLHVDDTAAAVTRIEAGAIDRLPAVSVPEVLATLPGIRVLAPRPFAGRPLVIMRGFFGGGEAEYVQLRVDHAPLADVESGLAPWRLVTLGQVGALEQFRGPGSSLYGDTAMAGVIEVVAPVQARRRARALVAAGSFESLDAELAGSVRRHELDAGLHLLHRRSRGFRPHGSARDTAVQGSVSRAGRMTWGATVLAHSDAVRDTGPLRADIFAADPDAGHPLFGRDREAANRVRATFGLRGAAGPLALAATVHAGRRAAERTRTLLLVPELGDTADRDLTSHIAGAALELLHEGVLFGRPADTRAGVEARRSGIDSIYRSTGGASASRAGAPAAVHRRELAAFASQGVRLTDRVRAYGGLRWDVIQDDVDAQAVDAAAWSPRAGLAVRLAGTASAYVQAARAFKAPTLDQRFDTRPFPDFRGGSFTIANPLLEPQRSTSVEAGVRGRAPLRWSAVAYRLTVDNEIDFDAATFTYGNIGRSRHSGVELEAAWDRPGQLALSGTYTWMSAVPLGGAARGRQLKNIPRHIWRAAAGLPLGRSTHVHVRYLRATGAYLDDANRVGLQGPSTIDARVEHTRGRVRFYFDALNLTNHRYGEYGFTLADFTGGQMAYLYPAAGAAARAGLDVRF